MKKIFLDMDGTLTRFNIKNALERFENERGFFANLLAYKGIENINEMVKNGNIYIISASPNIYTDIDKKQWLKKYIPNLKSENILLCRNGQNKAHFVESTLGIKIDKNCYLLDDYTKNLNEWEQAGGTGIKRMTKVSDNSTGKWKGLQLKDLCKLGNLVA